MMETKRIGLLAMLGAALYLSSACGKEPVAAVTPQAIPPVVSEEEKSAARAALGGDAEVLLFGALGGAGTEQVVAVDRLASARLASASSKLVTGASAAGVPARGVPGAGNLVTGIAVSRVSILSKENGSWREVLRGDEHLKNPGGYLLGAPAVGVAGWRLEVEQRTDKGRLLHFTPLAPVEAVKSGPVAVAWNPKAKRYQSLDRSGGKFLGEATTLEKPHTRLQ